MSSAESIPKDSAENPEGEEQNASGSSLRDRRDQPRFMTQFRGSLSGKHQEGKGRTLDISSGGCRIESDLKVEQGATFEFRLHIPGLDWPLRVDEATVRWTDGKTFGIAFTKINPQELEKLKDVLADLESEEE
ncbi:MAG: PilZ domain-containing protein [Nitrospira sp.]|nr:PilZ domain-containing protein [Nitrospira sp.]